MLARVTATLHRGISPGFMVDPFRVVGPSVPPAERSFSRPIVRSTSRSVHWSSGRSLRSVGMSISCSRSVRSLLCLSVPLVRYIINSFGRTVLVGRSVWRSVRPTFRRYVLRSVGRFVRMTCVRSAFFPLVVRRVRPSSGHTIRRSVLRPVERLIGVCASWVGLSVHRSVGNSSVWAVLLECRGARIAWMRGDCPP